MRTHRSLITCTIALAAATLPAAAAPAEEGAAGQGGIDLVVIPSPFEGIASALTAIVVFGIVLYVLGTVVWPKIQGGLRDREEKIRTEIAAAEAAREQAKSALEEYEKSLAKARADSQRMLDETRAQQSQLAAELRAKADAELSDMRAKALRDIDAAKKAALNEIYAESVTLATTIAGKILAREVTAQDQDRLVDESLAELSASRN